MEPLVRLLSTGVTAEAKAEAAGALWGLSSGDEDIKLTVADAGAIPPLVAMLSEGGRARLKAAGAIGSLAEGSVTYQAAVAQVGGIEPLVKLLGDGLGNRPGEPNVGVGAEEKHAASALGKLCRGHADNQASIAGAGAVKPLVTLLQGDCTALQAAAESAAKVAAEASAKVKTFIKNPRRRRRRTRRPRPRRRRRRRRARRSCSRRARARRRRARCGA